MVVPEKEYQEYMESLESENVPEEVAKPPTREEVLQEMIKADLTLLYKDTYQVTDEEVEAFEKLNKDDMVAELLGLEEDNE